MKLKKMMGLIVAVAMICTLVAQVSATGITLNVTGGDTNFQRLHVAGNSVMSAADKICWTLIRSVKFTFDIPNQHCGPNDQGVGEPCNKECIGVAAHGGGVPWEKDKGQVYVCYKDTRVITVDLNAHGWGSGKVADRDYWLEVAAASFVDGNTGTVQVEILGEGGTVLQKGASCDDDDCVGHANCGSGNTAGQTTTAATTSAPTGSTTPASTTTRATTTAASGTGTRPLQTGVGGVVSLGGMAVLAVGAVIISRKRK